MKKPLAIQNRGQAITDTNYWDSEYAQAGVLFLSWNAGAARLLIPDSQKPMLREMKGAREVIISRGPWPEMGKDEAFELMWEDGSDAPFAVHMGVEQTDRLLPEGDQGGGIVLAVWTRGGLKKRWPARYRKVERIPCMQPWVLQ